MDKWQKIRSEYINDSSTTYRGLVKKHKVSFSTLKKKAKENGWVKAREEQQHRIATRVEQKTAEIVAEKEVNRITRLLTIGDRLIQRIEEAERTIHQKSVVVKDKDTQVVELTRQKGKPGQKSTRHIIKEHARTEVVDALDTRALKDITWSLKTLLDTAVAGQAEQVELPISAINEQIHSLRDLIKNPQQRRELPERDSDAAPEQGAKPSG